MEGQGESRGGRGRWRAGDMDRFFTVTVPLACGPPKLGSRSKTLLLSALSLGRNRII